jgi:hypothetical protein
LKATEPGGQTKTRGKDLLREKSEQILSFSKNDVACKAEVLIRRRHDLSISERKQKTLHLM